MAPGAARTLKRQVAAYVEELLAGNGSPAASSGVALGLAPLPGGGVTLAIRYRLGTPVTRMVLARLREQLGPGVDVRRTGRVRAVPAVRPAATTHVPGLTPVLAWALDVPGRVRPLRPGASLGHVLGSAGTLGAVVLVDGVPHALSTYGVLVGSPSSRLGDPVLQPGRADGGQEPEDRVGVLAAAVVPPAGGRGLVAAALARLDDEAPAWPGPAWRPEAVTGPWVVEKTGRTTGTTTGRVSAVELDGVVVDLGPELGEVTLDSQLEVAGAGTGPFARAGDDGALVLRAAAGVPGPSGGPPGDGAVGHVRTAIGMLVACGDGGPEGAGLAYLDPIDPVLTALGAVPA